MMKNVGINDCLMLNSERKENRRVTLVHITQQNAIADYPISKHNLRLKYCVV